MMNLNNEIFYLINTKMSNSVFDIIMPNVTELGSLEVIAAVCIIFLILKKKHIQSGKILRTCQDHCAVSAFDVYCYILYQTDVQHAEAIHDFEWRERFDRQY